MARARMCEFPDDLYYDVELDVWAKRLEDGMIVLGMTDPAQTRAGKVLHIRARVGRSVSAGKACASIESAKWVGAFPTPLDGTIVEANPVVLADPNTVNRDPYGDGWIVKLVPDRSEWPQEALLPCDEAVVRYEEKLREAELTCLRCLPPQEA